MCQNITWPVYWEAERNSPFAWKDGDCWENYSTFGKTECVWLKKRERKNAIATTNELQRRMPLQNSTIFNGCCLHPVSQTRKSSLDMVEELAKAVHQFCSRDRHFSNKGLVENVCGRERLQHACLYFLCKNLSLLEVSFQNQNC